MTTRTSFDAAFSMATGLFLTCFALACFALALRA
jgi:hypothetical protein